MSTNKLFRTFPVWDMSIFNNMIDDIIAGIPHTVESAKGRPINRGYLKDDNGNVTNIILETLYTPFKKEDINVSVTDDVLHIQIGNDKNHNLTSDIEYDCHYISKRSFDLKFKLVGDIDTDNIDIEAVDGILKINLPIKDEKIPVTKILTVK